MIFIFFQQLLLIIITTNHAFIFFLQPARSNKHLLQSYFHFPFTSQSMGIIMLMTESQMRINEILYSVDGYFLEK